MLKGSAGRKGQECAHSALKNHPLSFIGRGKILAQFLWPGMETRLRRATGQLEGFSTEAVDTDGSYEDRDGIIRDAILNRGRFGRDGLTVEGARENLNIHSDDPNNVAYTKTRLGIGDDDLVSPDGGTNADKLIEDSSVNATHFIDSAAASFTSGIQYVLSCYLKPDERVELRFLMNGAAFPGSSSQWIDLSSGGSIGTTGSGIDSAAIENATDGWFRCWAVSTSDASASQGMEFLLGVPTEDNTYTGDGSSGMHFWRIQVEAAVFPSTGISTGAAAVTRSAEDLRLDNTSEVICKAAQGSMLFTVVPEFGAGLVDGDDIILFDVRTANDGFRILYDKTAGDLASEITSGGGLSAFLNGAAGRPVRGTKQIVALAWALDDFRLYNNAIELEADTSGAAPTAVNGTFFIGQDNISERQMFGQLGYAVITERSLTARQVENTTAVMAKAA